MVEKLSNVKVASVQISPICMDPMSTTNKICDYIKTSGKEGAKLILFPEAVISAYPWGVTFGVSIGRRETLGRDDYYRYWKGAIDVPGIETDMIGEAAKKAGSYVAVGVMERDDKYSKHTLYCTLLYFGPSGKLLGKHRKLKPTAGERYIWGEGDGSTMPTFDTEIGRFGGLICWENYMPLARMVMYSKGIDIYLAPTADSRDTWLASMKHIACESRAFVISSCQYFEKDMYPEDLKTINDTIELPDVLSRGGSVIVSPMGEVLAGPLYGEEGIIYADLDMSLPVKGRFDFDVVGHYALPNIFKLLIDEDPKSVVEHINSEKEEQSKFKSAKE